jgi:hypothetical protein
MGIPLKNVAGVDIFRQVLPMSTFSTFFRKVLPMSTFSTRTVSGDPQTPAASVATADSRGPPGQPRLLPGRIGPPGRMGAGTPEAAVRAAGTGLGQEGQGHRGFHSALNTV